MHKLSSTATQTTPHALLDSEPYLKAALLSTAQLIFQHGPNLVETLENWERLKGVELKCVLDLLVPITLIDASIDEMAIPPLLERVDHSLTRLRSLTGIVVPATFGNCACSRGFHTRSAMAHSLSCYSCQLFG